MVNRCCGALMCQAVGDDLCISGQTVKNHLTSALKTVHYVSRGPRAGTSSAMTAICWRIGYESALQDIAARNHMA